MVFLRLASSMINIISGTATTPLITALQNSILIGSIGVKLSIMPPSVAAVEQLGAAGLLLEAGAPFECFAQGERGRSGQHRYRQQTRSDDAACEQQEREFAGDRFQCHRGVRRRADVGFAVGVQDRGRGKDDAERHDLRQHHSDDGIEVDSLERT